MAITVQTKRPTFKLAPTGVFSAVLVDVINLGEVDTGFGLKPLVELVFQIDEVDPDGDFGRFIVSQRYNNSFNEKASLTPVAEALLGRVIRESERYPGPDAFDLESLLGCACQIEIGTHESKKGGVFNHISKAMPLARGQQPFIPDGYVRRRDRVEQNYPRPAA